MPGTTIHLDGWYSDAPKAIGEEPDLIPDELMEDGEDEVVLRTAEAILNDEDTLAWLHRDDAPAPRGWGMTSAEERRAWLMNRRLNYNQALREAIAKHHGRIAAEKVKAFPALRAESQFAWNVVHRWRFVDELARHGVHDPEKELVAKLKAALAPTYAEATAKLAERRRSAEAGRLDRFQRELRRHASGA